MYDESKGPIAIATGYSGGKYTYQKLNHDLLQQDTIQSTPDQMQDKDSYTNAKGYLRRTVMEHSRSKWEANTHIVSDKELDQLLSLFDKGFTVKDGECSKEKRHLHVRYYNDWKRDYATMLCYVPDITFQYKTKLAGRLYYQPVRFAFIEL